MTHRFATSCAPFLLAVAILGALVCGCGGSSKGNNAAAGSSNGEPPAGSTDASFLLASFSALAELHPDGSRKVLVQAPGGTFIRYPAISQDGKLLAFSRQDAAKAGANGAPDFGADIYVASRSGGDQKEIVHHARPGQFLGAPIFVDGNSRLLYSIRGLGEDGQPQIEVASVDLSSGATKVVLTQAGEPSVSRDGKELVFVSYDGDLNGSIVATSNLDGSDRKVLVPASANLAAIISPVFSPDGKRIAFAAMQKYTMAAPDASSGGSTAHPSTHDIWIVNRDGSDLHPFADIAEITPSLTWSGDGRWLYMLGQSGIYQVEGSKDVQRVGEGIGNSQIVWLSK